MRKAAQLDRQPWMTADSTQEVMRVLTAGAAPALFVGGCVRDAVLGRPVKDIDIATELPPDRVIERLEAAGVHAIPTGLAHGTITAAIPGGAWDHFEITTLRVDVETFGRHARVSFTDDWEADARRRDFTINAIFGDAEGRVYDPVGGLDDLRAGLVRFVGEAETRIREDVLRILRFFRLDAEYGRGAPDAAAVAGCTKLAHLLPQLSGERASGEFLRILASARAADTVALMIKARVLPAVLPEASAVARLAALIAVEELVGKPDPVRRLAAVLQLAPEGVDGVADRLRLSNRRRARLIATTGRPAINVDTTEAELERMLYRLGVDAYMDAVLLAWAESGAGPTASAWRVAADLPVRWPLPVFPLRGKDVLTLGVAAGPAVGALLAEAEAWWMANGFAPGRADCLAWLRTRAAELSSS